MKDTQAKGSAEVGPIDQYYYDLPLIVDDASEWMINDDDEPLTLLLSDKQLIKQQMDQE
jgi:hypothetical protein